MQKGGSGHYSAKNGCASASAALMRRAGCGSNRRRSRWCPSGGSQAGSLFQTRPPPPLPPPPSLCPSPLRPWLPAAGTTLLNVCCSRWRSGSDMPYCRGHVSSWSADRPNSVACHRVTAVVRCCSCRHEEGEAPGLRFDPGSRALEMPGRPAVAPARRSPLPTGPWAERGSRLVRSGRAGEERGRCEGDERAASGGVVGRGDKSFEQK